MWLWRLKVSGLPRLVLAVTSIFAVTGACKDFLWPLLVLRETSVQNLTVALSRMGAISGATPFTQLSGGMAFASVRWL